MDPKTVFIVAAAILAATYVNNRFLHVERLTAGA